MPVEPPVEIAIVGDLTENESDIVSQLLDVDPGGECILYFNSIGGSPYAALSLVSLIRLRQLNATAIVTGECSSSAVWPFAACRNRYVTPQAVLLFHPVKWESAEHVGLTEAANWARHFVDLEKGMDELLAKLFDVPYPTIRDWAAEHKFVSAAEIVKAGLAEMLDPLNPPRLEPAPRRARRNDREEKKRSRR